MTTRRDFLQQGSLALAGLLAIPTGLAAAEHKKIKKIGLGLFTLRNELIKDVRGTIANVAQAGFNTVETYYGYGALNGNGQFWGLDGKSFRSLLKEHHLTTPSGHYRLLDYLTKGNEKDLELKQMEVAAEVGQEYFVVPALPQNIRDNGSADDYKFIAAKFNKLAEACKKYDLKLAYHNHGFEFKKLPDNTTGYDILLNETDKANVFFEVDLFWAIKAGIDPITLFNQHPGRFPMWHVKDRNKNDGDKFAEVGTGSIDYKALFASKKTSGLKHFFIEQDEIYTTDRIESIRKSCQYTRDVLL